ncbi:MAG: FHA domain-containing protein [Bifidobacteriaceae bacterium]|nr:FHA domain-containing protein [Bifidobacteriaceae bacterium]
MTELTFAILKYSFVLAILLFVWLTVRSLHRDVSAFLPARDRRSRRHESRRVTQPAPANRAPAIVTAAPTKPSASIPSTATTQSPSLASLVTNTEKREQKQLQHPQTSSDAPTLLIIIDGPRAGSTFPLGDQSITLGRSTTNTIVLNDEYVSAHHSRLSRDAETDVWMLEDLGSTNGTYLNESRIIGRVPLTARVPVRLGATTFELR